MSVTMNSLWLGGALRNTELLTIHSHLVKGHNFRLFVYSDPGNVPEGVELAWARDVWDADYRHWKWRAAFADAWRYKFLYEHGGWWSDMDNVALRSFEYLDEKPFVWGVVHKRKPEHLNTGVLKVEKGHPILNSCLGFMEHADKKRCDPTGSAVWLWTAAVASHGLEEFTLPWYVFYPIASNDFYNLLKTPAAKLHICAYAVHIWGHQWKLQKINPNGKFDERCLFEILKRDYLPGKDDGDDTDAVQGTGGD